MTGGNASAGVVRVGDTVRRPAGPWTPAVHAVLDHLRAVGYRAAPRALGLDERGREVLTFAPGATVWPERFALLDPEDRLVHVARLIREFHDAMAAFTPPPDARWQVLMPAPGEPELIVHHDLAPWNLVLDEATDAWTFIDWDMVGPGTRLWDLAYAARGFVPLTGVPGLGREEGAEAARLRRFVDAYGLAGEAERRALVPLIAARSRAMHDFLRAGREQGREPWATLWREGHGVVWRGDAEHAERRAAAWTGALLD
ncbi:aminoglycoside phosphotransferase family protein [Streptomyces radicis]|uniref:Aminoglycoside phosphotransferase family protein n=1 Tax=Streptomyces radicis TaxID=1750517 RepID=A0A3A9WA90_9ACTN|nr:aminoglycoside phosphotransferase family protein [Streptomyces radicis]RKN23447.1 aminoglycoside phosphotransferase family protein [Streptomyces radicis]